MTKSCCVEFTRFNYYSEYVFNIFYNCVLVKDFESRLAFTGVVVVMLLLSRKRQKLLAERRKKNLRKTQRKSVVKDSEFIGKI